MDSGPASRWPLQQPMNLGGGGMGEGFERDGAGGRGFGGGDGDRGKLVDKAQAGGTGEIFGESLKIFFVE